MNDGEAEVVVAFLRTFLREGYAPKKLTVLTAYRGQMLAIRIKLKALDLPLVDANTADGITVLTIDMYQGDENDVVLVSLVRSNPEGKLGFLRIPNRLCVSASRAKCGLYFFGNGELLKADPHWRNLIDKMSEEECYGEAVTLRCPRHSTVAPRQCSSRHDFERPVCAVSCGKPLHTVRCQKFGHVCESQCHAGECPPCTKSVLHRFPCGHTKASKCTTPPVQCEQVCGKPLSKCGHPCSARCTEPCIDSASCGLCIAAAEERRKAELRAHAAAITAVCESINKEIEAFEAQARAGEEKALEELKSDHHEYITVKKRVEQDVSDMHPIHPVVVRVLKVTNLPLYKRQLQARTRMVNSADTHEQWKYHGTAYDTAHTIAREGFKLPKGDKGSMFGSGVYLASESSKSAQGQYAKLNDEGLGTLLVCSVYLGATKSMNSADPAASDPAKREREQYDSVYAMPNSKATGGVIHDEFVVYDAGLVLPKYIVVFRPHTAVLSLGALALGGSGGVGRDRVVMVSIKPNESPLGSENDMLYRLAESQYLRLTRWNAAGRDRPNVTSVDWYRNPALERRYADALRDTGGAEVLVFHGTSVDVIPKIMAEGLKVGGREVSVAVGQAHGQGAYAYVVSP